MTTVEDIRNVISRRLEHVTELGSGVLRAERRHEGRPYAVAYFDLSDEIVQRSDDLTSFQEHLLGSEFFNSEGDLRWNSYMYFVAGPNSTGDDRYMSAKSHIEGDRHFARKFVIAPDDLALRLGEPAANESTAVSPLGDVDQVWANLLTEGSLALLLSQPPRKTTLDKIADGDAFAALPTRAVPRAVRDPLGRGMLRIVSINSFRPASDGLDFSFGNVNLIVGSNGTGKTSLLEAVEALYCGRIRRDSSAMVSGVKGKFENGDGTLVEISAEATPAMLKARNNKWYGRADFQATALSEAFTRFNFLDTDAAFRLSTAEKPEDIREDLDKLLVGSETSGLWEYLSKLHEELKGRIKTLTERLPQQQQSMALLQAEVERLKSMPSEASSLVTAYRESLRNLAPAWRVTVDGGLDEADRVKLETLRQDIGRIQSAVVETPLTTETIEGRIRRMQEALDTVKNLQGERDFLLKREADELKFVEANDVQKALLERWTRLLEAGVPELAGSLQLSNSRVAQLRRVLRDWPGESLPPLAADYVAVGVGDAQEIASERLASSQEHEKQAQVALAQSTQLGQSLQTLRRDLHDAAVGYIERSGEISRCPVCKTDHVPSDLSLRLDELVASQEAGVTESFRRNLQIAREQSARCLQDTTTIAALARFAEVSQIPLNTSCGSLLESARVAATTLTAAAEEVQIRQGSLRNLQAQGLQTEGWERLRDESIAPTLPSGVDVNSQSEIVSFLADFGKKATEAVAKAAECKINAQALAKQIDDTLNVVLGAAVAAGSAPQVAILERALRLTEAALPYAVNVVTALALAPTASFDEIGAAVESTILAFNKARHAVQADSQARNNLDQRSSELATASELLAGDTKKRANLLRASETLTKLVAQHSLEDATKEAFDSIRERVSSIFAQIHSPQEYSLGDFSSDALIVNRTTHKIHAVNQVSTGQRAALALSIFLALNDSAKSAPPVILIDDPVAHIDDLNTLSFLDYLREVALRGEKQVFFATADIRLAALFQRKFEFLGGERFKRISLPLDKTET
jgi:DNA repair protein SbcC/Rad50